MLSRRTVSQQELSCSFNADADWTCECSTGPSCKWRISNPAVIAVVQVYDSGKLRFGAFQCILATSNNTSGTKMAAAARPGLLYGFWCIAERKSSTAGIGSVEGAYSRWRWRHTYAEHILCRSFAAWSGRGKTYSGRGRRVDMLVQRRVQSEYVPPPPPPVFDNPLVNT